jgi:hypothetical protein
MEDNNSNPNILDPNYDLSQLTDEEIEERIRELEAADNFGQAVTDEITAEEIKQEHVQEVHTSNLEAMAKGFGQGLLGHGVDDMQAAAAAVSDTIKLTQDAVSRQGMAGFDNVLSTYKEQFHKNHDLYNEEMKQLERDHPTLFGAAEVAGALTGTAAIGVGTAGYGLAAEIAAMGAYGFIHGAGSSNARTLDGRLHSAIQGGGTEAAMTAAFPAVGRAGKFAAKKAASVLGPAQLINYLAPSMKKFKQFFGIKEDTFEFANRMVNYTMDVERQGTKKTINVLQGAHTAEQSLDYIKKASVQTNTELARMYGHVDRVAPLPEDAVEEIADRLMSDVLPKISKAGKEDIGDQTFVKLREQLREKFDRDFFMNDPNGRTLKLANGATVPMRVPKKASISKLNRMKNEYFSHGGGNDEWLEQSLNKHYESAGKIIDEYIDSHIHANSSLLDESIPVGVKQIGEAGEEISETFYNTWTSSKTKARDLMHTEKLLHDRLMNPTSLDVFRDIFRNHVNKISLGAAVASSALGAPISVTGAVVGGIYMVAKSDRIQKAAALGLTKLATSIEKNPDKYSRLAMRLVAAADVSSDAFYERVMEAGAEVDLSESKLQRNFDDVMARQDSLVTLARAYDPAIVKQLKQAITAGDSTTVGSLLTSSPKMSKFISSGLGWEGRALSQTDKEAVAEYIKGLKPADRRKASLEFQKNQMIPERMLTGGDQKAKEIQVLYKLSKKNVEKFKKAEEELDIPIGVRAPEL